MNTGEAAPSEEVCILCGGAELARRLSARHPDTKVIYTSGYVEEGAMPPEISDNSVEFLHKPYPPTYLIAKIREILDDRPGVREIRSAANRSGDGAPDMSNRLSEETR